MKLKIAYIIATLGAAFVFNACKKDLGNYDYSTVNIAAIDTAGIGGARYVERYGMLDINPKITYEGGNMTALKYKWIMYPLTTGSTAPTKPARTLSEQLHLTAPVTETVGEYRLELIVTDTVNQLKSNMIFTVVVSVGIEYGVMVLHGTADSSDVDFLITADAVPLSGISPRRLRGLYAASTGAKLPGVPRFVAQERRTGSTQNWIMLGSDKHISRVSGSDFSLLREDKSFYRRSDAVVAPETFMFLNNSYSALINAGKLHVYTTTYEVDALFSAPVPGDYELAPYLANASASGMVAVVYDKKNGRFIHPASVAGSMIDFKAPIVGANMSFDHRNVGKDMLYMDRGYLLNTHSFFKDRTGNGYWLYVSNFNKADDGNMVIGAYNMTNLPDIAVAKFFQASELGYVDIYATDRKVYAYDYQGTNTAKVVFDALPANETITAMKLYKPRPNFNLSAVEGRLLYIATWDGTQGRLYEMAFNGVSGDITATPKNIFTGFGKIYDVSAKNRGSGTY